ncbi:hypothetical protein C0J52_21998 [Blattella germanica]|nr:hypothetical protein C0J52_21998 [Blattella germanica]
MLAGISIGMSMGHSAVLLPELQSPNSTLPIDEDMGSWIASVYAVAGPAGSLMGGLAIESWGRRFISFWASSGMVVGWALICIAQNVSTLIVGRITEGFSRSMLCTSLTILIDELSDPKYRGFTVSFVMTLVSFGVMFIMSLGALLEWRTASAIAGLITCTSIIPLLFLRESPSWQVRKNRLNDAAQGLRWLWGPGQEEQAETDVNNLINRYHKQSQTGSQKERKLVDKVVGMFKYFSQAHTIKPFLIIHVFNTIQAVCGLHVFTYYTIDILVKMRKNENIEHALNDNAAAVVISIARIISNVVATVMLLKVGRRLVALISGIGSSISALLLSVALLHHGLLFSVEIQYWLNFALTIGFAAFSTFGFFILPALMLGETQAASIRGFVCGYIYTVNDLVLGAILKCYPSMVQNLEIQGLFLLFGAFCLVCTVFVYVFLPETQGKTLEEIEDYFKMPNIIFIGIIPYLRNILYIYKYIIGNNRCFYCKDVCESYNQKYFVEIISYNYIKISV